MKAAGYVRVSTPQQKEEGSHETQRERLQKWAERNGYDLEVFQDIAISGQDPDRDAYQEIFSRLDEFDAVVVRELSRLGRDLKKVVDDFQELDDRDVDFISLRENIDTTTAQGKLFFHITAAFNQYWADLARERTKELYQRKMDEGKDWGRPRKLSDQQLKALLEDREKGISYNALSKIYEVSPATARKYCERYQLDSGEVKRVDA